MANGITSVSFGGSNKKGGDDLYVTAATRYLNFDTGRFERRRLDSVTLFKVSGIGAGESFTRASVKY